MKSLHDIRMFVQVAQTGNISAVARSLNVSTAAISTALKRLESELDCRLVIRSTRKLRLTPEGEVFYNNAIKAILLLDQAKNEIHDQHKEFTGQLNISAPSDFGRNVLLPWVNEFSTAHPGLSLQLYTTDTQSNLYEEPVDLAFRYGELPDSSLVASSIAPNNRRVLVASPDYIASKGEPLSPQDLINHDCITFIRNGRVFDEWYFEKQGQEQKVRINSSRIANDGDIVKKWAVQGYGISYRSFLDVYQEINSGQLVKVCENWTYQALPLNMVYADRKQITPAMAKFKDFVKLKISHIF